MSVITILLVAVSTAQISSMVITNDNPGNNVYAQGPIPSRPGPPFSKQVLEVRIE
jgi:hypothetical protein